MKRKTIIALSFFLLATILTGCSVETPPTVNNAEVIPVVESKTQEPDPSPIINEETPAPIPQAINTRQEKEEPKAKTNTEPKTVPKTEVKTEPKCHPSYSACLNPDASDYDCSGGSGNGPYYTGKVKVVGPDVFDLDRDNDGWGCE